MGQRRQLYYAAKTVVSGLTAPTGLFILQDTLEPYEGSYCIANGTFLTGPNPSRDSQVLILQEGKEAEKFKYENSSKYFELTRREYTRHTLPEVFYPEPDEDDYNKGQFQRFFVQKINDPSLIYEIDQDQYKAVNRENKVGINKLLYKRFELQWMLTGLDAASINKSNIEIQSIENPGLDRYLENTMQFVRGEQRTQEREYPDGEPIPTKLPGTYNTPQKQGQGCINCKFRNNNFRSNYYNPLFDL